MKTVLCKEKTTDAITYTQGCRCYSKVTGPSRLGRLLAPAAPSLWAVPPRVAV